MPLPRAFLMASGGNRWRLNLEPDVFILRLSPKRSKLGSSNSLSDRSDLERVMGIEPTFEAWEAPVLPLNYTRRSVQSSLARNTIQASTNRLVRSCGWRIRNLIKRSTRQGLPPETPKQPDALDEPDAFHQLQGLVEHSPRRVRQLRRV